MTGEQLQPSKAENSAPAPETDNESIWDAAAELRKAESKVLPLVQGDAPITPEPSPALGSVEAVTRAARLQGALLPGSTFGVYAVGECIGEGGMARIYRAEHAGLRRQVALKVLTNGFARDPDGRERFVREARIAAAIKHPNVVNIFDVGVHEEIPYLVMELLEGTDLESMVEEKGALEESAILDIMVPVVAGLTAVHDAGIVHRDLKPGNIFLAKGRYEEFEPKLLDFGISKVSGAEQLKLTTSGLLMGTPFYMSPEGFRGEEMTPLSDQYSLGVVMYECATGCGPFKATTLAELVRIITTGDYRPPNEHNPNISKRLARIILRAMSLDPAQRFKDLREMGRELLQLSGQRTRITWGLSFGELKAAAEEPGTGATARSIPPAHSPTRAKKALLGVMLALLPVVLLVMIMALGERGNRDVSESSLRTPASSPAPAEFQGQAAGAAPLPVAASTGPEVVPIANSSGPVSRLKQRISAARTRTHAASQDEPEWALPSAAAGQSRMNENKPPPGTNGAPIFD